MHALNCPSLRRSILAAALVLRAALFFAPSPCCRAEGPAEEPLSRIAFGSCDNQDKPQDIWKAINALNPQAWVMIGDNIYSDTTDMAVLRANYAKLGATPGFQQLRKNARMIVTWDDHDYGENDAGSEYTMRDASQKEFLTFWNEPKDSDRWKRPGVYASYIIGPPGKRVQFIMLDTRYFRTTHLKPPGEHKGPQLYLLDDRPEATMLGEAQWKWLEGELKKPAELRVIGSSIQFLADFHGIESWAVYPRERDRMLKLLADTKADGAMFISGDVHWGEIMRMERPGLYPVYDVTSSGLTHTHGFSMRNELRLGKAFTKLNFGLITVDWNAPDPVVTLQVRDVNGEVVVEHAVKLGELRAPKK